MAAIVFYNPPPPHNFQLYKTSFFLNISVPSEGFVRLKTFKSQFLSASYYIIK